MAEALSDSVSELDPQTTDQSPSLSQETLIALMTMKLNCLECCYESTFTEKLLRECECKKAKAVKPIDDIINAKRVVSGCGFGVACVPKAN